MKTSIKSLAVALVMCGMIGSASAMVHPQEVYSKIRSAIGSGSNVNVTVNGDTTTLSGYVADAYDRIAAERAARQAGADKVINLITRSN